VVGFCQSLSVGQEKELFGVREAQSGKAFFSDRLTTADRKS